MKVILLGEVSHPPHTRLEACILGGVKCLADDYALIAVPLAEEKFSPNDQGSQFGIDFGGQICDFPDFGGKIEWLNEDGLEALIRDATARYYQAQREIDRVKAEIPAWHPVDRDGRVVGYTEAEHYTDAEYTYF